MNIENKQFTDKYELYSYSTYLYFYAFLYIFI